MNSAIETANRGDASKEAWHEILALTAGGRTVTVIVYACTGEVPGVVFVAGYAEAPDDQREGAQLEVKDAEVVRDALMKIAGK